MEKEAFHMDGGDHPSTVCLSEPPANGEDSMEAATAAEPEPEAGNGPGRRPDGCEALARAIASTLGDVMREFDDRSQGAARSQDELAQSLDRFTGELDRLLEEAPMPFIMQHATKISSIHKRISALNLLLKSIQRRIDNVDKMLSIGMSIDNVPHDAVKNRR